MNKFTANKKGWTTKLEKLELLNEELRIKKVSFIIDLILTSFSAYDIKSNTRCQKCSSIK